MWGVTKDAMHCILRWSVSPLYGYMLERLLVTEESREYRLGGPIVRRKPSYFQYSGPISIGSGAAKSLILYPGSTAQVDE